jgi:hypothetical protein
MPRTLSPNPHHPNHDVPDERDQPQRPVEPDEGRAPPLVPDDLAHDRLTDPVIVQAKRDIDAGMVDTDMHATPGLDATLRTRLNPGPGGKPPSRR